MLSCTDSISNGVLSYWLLHDNLAVRRVLDEYVTRQNILVGGILNMATYGIHEIGLYCCLDFSMVLYI